MQQTKNYLIVIVDPLTAKHKIVDIAMKNIAVRQFIYLPAPVVFPRRDTVTLPALQSASQWLRALARPGRLKNRFRGVEIGGAAESAELTPIGIGE